MLHPFVATGLPSMRGAGLLWNPKAANSFRPPGIGPSWQSWAIQSTDGPWQELISIAVESRQLIRPIVLAPDALVAALQTFLRGVVQAGVVDRAFPSIVDSRPFPTHQR